MNEVNNKFSCLIIGGGTLPILCAEVLLRSGHEICAIVSVDPRVRKWSDDNMIPWFVPGAKLEEQIERPFDYLFSIVNEHILAEDILRLPRQLAINYHDAPLPRYAGTHATSWALMNGETVHGISWHVITDLVDGGDVLKQKHVNISKDDTALTLNTKCYEAAIEAFVELVEDISSGNLVRKKQDLERRTFFPRFKRPINGGVISWNDRADRISALVRALDFGDHPNPLGKAKLAVENEFFIVPELEILDSLSKSSPGTINKIGPDFIQIDAADQEIILRHVSQLDGQPVSIPDLVAKFHLHKGYQFRDFDSEAARRIDGLNKAIRKHEEFWVSRLSDLEPTVPPFANNHSSFGPVGYANFSMQIPNEVLTFLGRLGGHWKLDDFLPAAFGALLVRLGGIDSFDVGYNDSEMQKEIEGLENLFAAQVPLHFNIDCLQSYTNVIKTVKEELDSIKTHKTYATDLVIRYPQFRTAFESVRNFTLPIAISKVERWEEFKPQGSQLTLLISESESECRWIYDREKLSEQSIDKLVRHFTILIKGIAANPECQIAYLPLVPEAELRQLLVEWNDTRADYPKDKCIHELFESQVSSTPDAVALIFGNDRLTYRELNHRANQLANYLRTLGVGPEVLVGICVERSLAMIIGILASLKAGGAHVPLDPAYPRERIEHMLADSQAAVLLTQEKLVDGLRNYKGKIVQLDRDAERINQEPDQNPVSLAKPNNLAYVIYTSGSTGKPKGVAIEHRSTVALLQWATSVFTSEQLKGVLASTSMCFDLSVYEMFAPLSCGGTIILVENILHLPDARAATEVTLINTVPSAVTELLRIKGIPPSVRTVNLAGEPLKTSLVQQIYETGTVREVFDLYGPSEDTTYSTFTLRDTGKATIGRPISNTQAYILDRNLQPVPVGIPGELYLGGDGLARGYLNQPELTAERFITNLFSQDSAARLYKTGDLVRYQPSGKIEYLGRIDNQVKIRGFRIELGEIESVLSSHAAVQETVVIAREDQLGEKQLVAYFVPAQGYAATIGDLRTHLKQSVPDFMMPSAFVELIELPLTPNGKIDRKALPVPASTPSESKTDFVAHRDDLELRLVRIWESILGIQPIGVEDDFFELGGHSLKAVRMFAEIEETFGKNIPLATLFEAGTIEKLAAILRQDGWAAPESSLVPIQPNGTKPPFFCIHAKGGNVLFYRDLAKYLGDDQPFYGIQARRLAGRQIGHARVEEMAEFYIKEIQTLQHNGPYYIGGSSFGGLVAFEIAQQLQRQGKRIALLALLDTGTPDYPKMLPNTTALRSKTYQLIRRAQHHKDSLKAFSKKEKAGYVLEKLKKVKLKYRRKIRNTYKKAVRKFYGVTKGMNSIPKSYIQIEDLIWKAGQKYSPEVYRGSMTLFRASIQPLGIQPDATLGWECLVDGELEIYEVPGHHGSIVAEPYVRILAEKLIDCLESVHLKEKQFMEESKPVELHTREFVQTAGLGIAP